MKFEVKGKEQIRILYITLDTGIIISVYASTRGYDGADMHYAVSIDDEPVFYD